MKKKESRRDNFLKRIKEEMLLKLKSRELVESDDDKDTVIKITKGRLRDIVKREVKKFKKGRCMSFSRFLDIQDKINAAEKGKLNSK